jgi:hypothetical protein
MWNFEGFWWNGTWPLPHWHALPCRRAVVYGSC